MIVPTSEDSSTTEDKSATLHIAITFVMFGRVGLGANFNTKARLGFSSSVMDAEYFASKQVPWLKEFLQKRGVQTSGKRKAELADLCLKSHEIKLKKLDELEQPQSSETIIALKLQTQHEGTLPNPLCIAKEGWSHTLSAIPQFGFPDMYNYLVGKCAYSQESLKCYKSLLGYKLYFDGHVENLQCHHKHGSTYHLFKFAVQPTERSKLDGGQSSYKGFFILKNDGSVHSGYCQCKGG